MKPINRACQALALTFLPLSLPSLVSVAAAQSAHVRTAPNLVFVTSHLTAGVVHNRLVPLGHAKASSSNSWVIERRFTDYRGSRAVLQVMTIGAADHVHTDSILFDRATLRPIWEHLHGGTMATLLSFDGTHVTGRFTHKDFADRAIKLTTTVPSFSSTIDDMVAQSIPLDRGYQVTLPFVGRDGSVQSESILVRRGERVSTPNGMRTAWVVDLSYPSGSETLWVDAGTRVIIRHIYTMKDHSQLELAKS